MIRTKVGGSLIAVLFTIGLLALPNTAAAQAANDRLVFHDMPFVSTVVDPCTNESVDISANTNLALTLHADVDGGISIKIFSLTKGTGVGLLTLFNYKFSESFKLGFKIPAGLIEGDSSVTDKFRLNGPGSLDNWDIKATIRINVTRDGVVKSVVESLVTECRG